ncbi:hypothetical protein [Tissierella sp.]|uniref:hypothetical protein n=1 Tax=Tissierella sp. TaxID=41274 RepID=UPI0030381838
MNDDKILKLNTVLKQRDNIKENIDKDLQKKLNIYLINILLILQEEDGIDYLDYNLFF